MSLIFLHIMLLQPPLLILGMRLLNVSLWGRITSNALRAGIASLALIPIPLSIHWFYTSPIKDLRFHPGLREFLFFPLPLLILYGAALVLWLRLPHRPGRAAATLGMREAAKPVSDEGGLR